MTNFFDNRAKLLPCQKQLIRHLRETDGISVRKLSQRFNVSRATILYICQPELTPKNTPRSYDRDKNTARIRKHRLRKKELAAKINTVTNNKRKP